MVKAEELKVGQVVKARPWHSAPSRIRTIFFLVEWIQEPQPPFIPCGVGGKRVRKDGTTHSLVKRPESRFLMLRDILEIVHQPEEVS